MGRKKQKEDNSISKLLNGEDVNPVNPPMAKDVDDSYIPMDMPNPIFKEIREIEDDSQPAKDTICLAIKNLTSGIRSTRKIPHDLMIAMAICSGDEFMRNNIENILAAFDTNDWKAKNYQIALKSLGGPLAAMMLGEVLREGGRGLFGMGRGYGRLNRLGL